jgi:hypothetical protein
MSLHAISHSTMSPPLAASLGLSGNTIFMEMIRPEEAFISGTNVMPPSASIPILGRARSCDRGAQPDILFYETPAIDKNADENGATAAA